jgi:hypothetical protein
MILNRQYNVYKSFTTILPEEYYITYLYCFFLSAYNWHTYSSKIFIRLVEKKMAAALLTIRHNFHLYT